jgi:glycosyltransferase involved in cell wall biosynthesis
MPVYNEEVAVTAVVAAWAAELQRLGVDYELRAYDDGSRDATARLLAEAAATNPRLVVTRHENRGHGPTVLRGYLEARGEWVFQLDSDGEMPPSGFEGLWTRRRDYDFLVGSRLGRETPWMRQLVSAVSRATVRLLFGRGVKDVNSPYRLMRASSLHQLLAAVRGEPFAPNVILSGLAARSRLRIWEGPVPCLGRRTGTGSLTPVKVLKAAARSFGETVAAGLSRQRPPRSV